MIRFKQKGDFKNLESFLNKASKFDMRSILDRYGREGVEALRSNTPIDSGLTASSWDYYVDTNKRTSKIVWTNTHNISGVNIAIILQYGHTRRNTIGFSNKVGIVLVIAFRARDECFSF